MSAELCWEVSSLLCGLSHSGCLLPSHLVTFLLADSVTVFLLLSALTVYVVDGAALV